MRHHRPAPPWLLPASLALGLVLVIGVVVAVFMGAGSLPNSNLDEVDPPGSAWDEPAGESAPPFSIPKVPGCARADTELLDQIRATLQDRTDLSMSAQSTDGDLTFVAAIVTYNGEPSSREPGLWVLRDGRLYAVGGTTAYSTAPPGTDVGVRGDSNEAARAVACAAGY